MKYRTDFVTNSSSSSYIICFARIDDEEKAQKIIDKFELYTYDTQQVKQETWTDELGAPWCGAVICGIDSVLKEHPNSKYIIIEDSNEAYCDDEECEPIYSYDFDMNDAIAAITEENGFANIDVAEGEGYNG